MNLHRLLQERATSDKPLRVGLIGAGKFGTMFLAQARQMPGVHLLGVADLAPERASESLRRIGYPAEQIAARSLGEAVDKGTTWVGEDASALLAHSALDIAIEATGIPAAGTAHAFEAIAHGKHIIMVNVEADVLVGPLLARRAREAGVVYSLAYGDQPALIAEQVDWARACGLEVIAAGKGTKYLPAYHTSTPETVWEHYGLTSEEARQGGMNPQMFNSFLDGTKSAIEMAAVANATGLSPAPGGLSFPPCGVDDLASVLRPAAEGGILHHKGQVEVVSSLERDGRPVFRDLRWGVYVVFEAPTDYVQRCFAEYGLVTDSSGHYSALYRPYHLIGLELGISVASVGLRNESTGQPTGWRGDAVATSKRDLKPGETLDGEGGFTVWGRLLPAEESLRGSALPIGLAHHIQVTRAIRAGDILTYHDVAVDESSECFRVRREMERTFADANPADLPAA
ncbi:MAG: flagellar biosynthesis protein FlgA [Gammaproteobacteria bacterium]|nr:flagellar biosynthesis protein FlgA [Gammaproteobacteria bacterium]